MIRLLRKKSPDPAKELTALLPDYELPSFRAIVLGTLRLLRDESAGADQLAAQIELDPGLHTRVLRTVNSAAFGLTSQVSSVPHAVALLGRSRLEPIVLALAVKDTLPSTAAPGFDARRFWHGSAVRAMSARGFAKRLHAGSQDQAFAAGLLLDMAVPVLASVKGAGYTATYKAASNRGGSTLAQLEQESLGYDHMEVGRLIAESWDLPDYLRAAIAGHHDPAADDVEPAVKLAALVEDEDPARTEPVAAAAEDWFGLEEDEATSVMEDAFSQARDFAGLLG